MQSARWGKGLVVAAALALCAGTATNGNAPLMLL